MSEIILYQDAEKQIQIEVKLDGETVWLSQDQIAAVFGTQRPAITKHLKNIFTSGELNEKVVSSILEHTTRHGAIKGKAQVKNVKYYNLDAIISVGYRINSKQATLFRKWATQRLKDYLVKGYTINQKRLEQLQQTIQLISAGGNIENIQLQEAKGLLEILSNYTKSFVLLNQFDGNKLVSEKLDENITCEIQYQEAKAAIVELKKQLIKKREATYLFGNEKDESFKSLLQSIVQTFSGQYFYPGILKKRLYIYYIL